MFKVMTFSVALSCAALGVTSANAATDIALDTGAGFDWTVNGVDAVRVSAGDRAPAWTGGPSDTWISDRNPADLGNVPGGTYSFSTVLTLANVGNIQTWSGNWWADNIVTRITVNGIQVGASMMDFFNINSNQNEFTPGTGRSFVFSDTVWQNGDNNIVFTVQNRTLNGRNDMGLNLLSSVSAVPEPGTWMLMILGLGAVGFAMRSRGARSVRFRFA